jgi:hypothetical protein
MAMKDLLRKTIALGIMGCCAEVAFAKSKDKYFNGSYSDQYSRYTDTKIAGPHRNKIPKKKGL